MTPVSRRRRDAVAFSSRSPIVSGRNRPSGDSNTGLISSPAFEHIDRLVLHQLLEPLGERGLAAADRAEQIEDLLALFEALRGVLEVADDRARSCLPCRRSLGHGRIDLDRAVEEDAAEAGILGGVDEIGLADRRDHALGGARVMPGLSRQPSR